VVFPAGGKDAAEDRYSIAYFGHPIGDTVLEPVPSEKVKALAGRETSEVKAMTAHEHLMSRLKATYLGMYKEEDEEKGMPTVEAAA
jgi:isopenicillin N synthase-like dioxygenase